MSIKPCALCWEDWYDHGSHGKTFSQGLSSCGAATWLPMVDLPQWWTCCAMGGGWGRCGNVGPLGRWVLSRAGAQMYMWDISELQTRTVSIDAPENLCTCSLLALHCNISFVVSDSTVRASWKNLICAKSRTAPSRSTRHCQHHHI